MAQPLSSTESTTSPRHTPFNIWLKLVLSNWFLLSLMYLGSGLAAEVLRHLYPLRPVTRTLLILEQTPARTLELLGLMEPLRRAYLEEQVTAFTVRWAYGFTMMAIVFITAVLMASLMAGTQRLWILLSGSGRARES